MLFDPMQIGKLTLSNRLVFLPVGTEYGDEEGFVTDKMIRHYARRAAGGVGMIIVEAIPVDPGGRGSHTQGMIERDDRVVGWSRFVREVKSAGDVKVAIQLFHVGRQGNSHVIGQQPVAPSAIALFQETPRELSVGEVKVLVEKFAQAVRRAKEAGFDAAEIHGAHGYLICGFLSPWSNKRTDEYGGDTERRARFALEIIQRSRELVGEDYPLFMRVSASEYVKGGIDLEEMKRLAPMFERAGICLLSISAGNYIGLHMFLQPMNVPRGCLVPLAEGVKQVVNIPVLVAGRINDPRLAEQILQERRADLIGMGRPLIADPDLPNKAKSGKFDSIRKCLACNSCADIIFSSRQLECAINPEVGNEGAFEISPASRRKKVMVVGGGPAGLDAARILAEKGHEVVLYEKERQLGGQLNLAGAPPDKEEFRNFIEYLKGQLMKLGVKMVLGEEVTPETAGLEQFDEVVVATGASPIVPKVPGIERKHVVMAKEVLEGRTEIGKNVVVIGAGGTGCATALYLTEMSKKVTLVEMLGKIGMDMGWVSRRIALHFLEENGVALYTNMKLEEVTESGVVVSRNGERRALAADAVVLAMGVRSEIRLLEYLKGRGIKVHAIGDCKQPRKVIDAVHEAFEVAHQI